VGAGVEVLQEIQVEVIVGLETFMILVAVVEEGALKMGLHVKACGSQKMQT